MKKTFAFDFEKGEFVMKDGNPVVLSSIDALKMWIEKCVRTQLGRYSIYKGQQYGANIEDLVSCGCRSVCLFVIFKNFFKTIYKSA